MLILWKSLKRRKYSPNRDSKCIKFNLLHKWVLSNNFLKCLTIWINSNRTSCRMEFPTLWCKLARKSNTNPRKKRAHASKRQLKGSIRRTVTIILRIKMVIKRLKEVEELEVDTLTKMEGSKWGLPKSKGTTTHPFNNQPPLTSHHLTIIWRDLVQVTLVRPSLVVLMTKWSIINIKPKEPAKVFLTIWKKILIPKSTKCLSQDKLKTILFPTSLELSFNRKIWGTENDFTHRQV